LTAKLFYFGYVATNIEETYWLVLISKTFVLNGLRTISEDS